MRSIETKDKCEMIIGATEIPFTWTKEYNIIPKCKVGWIYLINITKGTSKLLKSYNSIAGYTADKGDTVLYFACIERN